VFVGRCCWLLGEWGGMGDERASGSRLGSVVVSLAVSEGEARRMGLGQRLDR
jgi:hypothetical protein